ncbi:unnamed protein product [Strongylus vulgaris]|uniref:Uncharacterized protein n=1 Tax=Strongylus vulgaris TaxID=40348 RepID=A0A3P7I134_STRVU|nr:unnamed protein product [Strongylus vulgaris]
MVTSNGSGPRERRRRTSITTSWMNPSRDRNVETMPGLARRVKKGHLSVYNGSSAVEQLATKPSDMLSKQNDFVMKKHLFFQFLKAS